MEDPFVPQPSSSSRGEVAFSSSAPGQQDGFLEGCPAGYQEFAKFVCVQIGCPKDYESCGPYCTKEASGKPDETSTCVKITVSGITPVIKLTVMFTIAMITGGPVSPVTWIAVTYQVSRLLRQTVWP